MYLFLNFANVVISICYVQSTLPSLQVFEFYINKNVDIQFSVPDLHLFWLTVRCSNVQLTYKYMLVMCQVLEFYVQLSCVYSEYMPNTLVRP